jgi:hypothetical protein
MPAGTNHHVNAWTAEGREREFTTSLGDVILIRNLEFDDVIELGLIDDLDSLSAIVQTEHLDRVAGKKPTKKQQREQEEAANQTMMSMMKDKEKSEKISNVLTQVVMCCVIEPKILDPYIEDPNAASAKNPTGRRKLEKNERDLKACYADYIGLQDKMRIFSEVFAGMEQLEKFREEPTQGVGDLAAVPSTGDDAS